MGDVIERMAQSICIMAILRLHGFIPIGSTRAHERGTPFVNPEMCAEPELKPGSRVLFSHELGTTCGGRESEAVFPFQD